MNFNLADIMCPTDTRNLARMSRMQAIYEAIARIARAHKPRTVCEIGVRAGYSAYTWMSESPNAQEYLGIDMDDTAQYGGPWLWWAEQLLARLDVTWEIRQVDSQAMTVMPYGRPFDLIHVDGDHSYEGCMHDMKICWPAVAPGGVMVVDDCTYLPGPVRAVRDFAGTVMGASRIYLEKSPTGSMVFVKEGG